MTSVPDSDEAMLNYLAGDHDVRAAAAAIWHATGRAIDTQRELETAIDAYSAAIRDSGIPAAHAERLGAALILRLNRARLLTELEHATKLAVPDGEP